MKPRNGPPGLKKLRGRAQQPPRRSLREIVQTMETPPGMVPVIAHLQRMNEQHEAAQRSPLEAFRVGRGYIGPAMPDKGQKDGSCNRTACQLPLAGMPQWRMPDHMGGWLHYCQRCAFLFEQADRDMGRPFRCQPVED